jgi:hypothetical protein
MHTPKLYEVDDDGFPVLLARVEPMANLSFTDVPEAIEVALTQPTRQPITAAVTPVTDHVEPLPLQPSLSQQLIPMLQEIEQTLRREQEQLLLSLTEELRQELRKEMDKAMQHAIQQVANRLLIRTQAQMHKIVLREIARLRTICTMRESQ